MGFTVYEIRLSNLLILMKESGFSKSEFAEKIDTQPAYLSQIRSKKTPRDMGNDLARKIETLLDKPRGWMDTYHGGIGEYMEGEDRRAEGSKDDRRLTNKLIQNLNNDVLCLCDEVPLLDRDKIEDFIKHHHLSGMEQLITTTVRVGKKTFAMRYFGDSMEGEFSDGDMIIVEPDHKPKHGDFVAAKLGNDISLRQLWIEAGDMYLRPMNKMYPPKLIVNSNIIGTVREKIKRYF